MPRPDTSGSRPTTDSPLRILLVSHTHWDREWYHTAGRFRQRLVALVDDLLDGAAHADAPFLLDGQTIVLEDYLTVRPEAADALRGRLQKGAVEAGPWYVLADGLIPSGEAILRNLEAGRDDMTRWGAPPPAVLYCPDTFGHAAALPMVAAGYGFELAVVWRGLGGMQHPAVDMLWWHAANGTKVLVHHLPPDGYETGSALPTDPAVASERWNRLLPLLAARNSTGVTLLTNGADHHALQPDLDAAIAVAQRVIADADAGASLERVSLSTAARVLVVAAAAHEREGNMLPSVSGELRDSYGYTWALQGTFGTRAHQKRRNARLERALLHDVEPWIALAWLHGRSRLSHTHDAAPRDGQPHMETLAPLLRHTWRTLLRTHPHDTLCGCSIDAVARAMDAAQDDVAAQVVGLRAFSLSVALRHSNVAGRALPPNNVPRIIVRNRAANPRSGIARLRVLSKVADVPVGPGSGAASGPPLPTPDEITPPFGSWSQLLRTTHRHHRRESPQHYPDNDLVREQQVLAWVPTVPAHGTLTLSTAADEQTDEPPTRDAANGQHLPFSPATCTQDGDSFVLTNGRLAVTITPGGISLSLGQRTVHDVLQIEAQHDAGDSYTPSFRGAPLPLQMRHVVACANGPLRATCAVHWESGTGADRVRVRTELALDAESDVLQVAVTVQNRRRDYRLQLRFRNDVGADAVVWADAAFGPVPRVPVIAPSHAAEISPSTMPMHRWLASADAARGATLLSDGLAESEAGSGYLAVTLLRAIGELSRDDLPERPGHAGWPASIPHAQCRGTFHARVGLLLHGAWSDDTLAHVERATDDFLLPLVGETFRDQGALPASLAGPELVGTGLRASAVTISRDGTSLILRATNETTVEQGGAWRLPSGFRGRYVACRLDETPLSAPLACAERIDFMIAPRDVLTFRIDRASD